MIKFCILQIVAYLVQSTTTCLRTPIVPGCNIPVSKLNLQPIVVSTTTQEFLYPEPGQNTVFIAYGADVIISCPSGYITEDYHRIDRTVVARCYYDTKFNIQGRIIDVKKINCSKNPSDTARYTGDNFKCDGKEIEVGFLISSTNFVRQYLVCFNDSNKVALYSEFNLTKSIGQQQIGVPRQNFDEGNFYNLGIKVDDLYSRYRQKLTINALLGLPANSSKYVQYSNNFYLARGHLAAKADFVYAPQQMATFHYCNVAPQWQTFNGNNWKTVERNVRDYAESKSLDLRVYTGTYGVTTLPHEQTRRDIPLYLYVDSNGNMALPVPELFWKVVYDPKSKRGVALLGVNNPYQRNITKSIICKDIQYSITWLSWKSKNLTSGYSYACAVDDFRKKVPYLPKFEVKGLLV